MLRAACGKGSYLGPSEAEERGMPRKDIERGAFCKSGAALVRKRHFPVGGARLARAAEIHCAESDASARMREPSLHLQRAKAPMDRRPFGKFNEAIRVVRSL